jgi:ribosomal protein S27E
MYVGCPNCKSPIEIAGDSPSSEIDCSSCGSRFVRSSADTISYVAGHTVTYIRDS